MNDNNIRIIIETPPGQGKTTLANEIADRLRLYGVNVKIFDQDTDPDSLNYDVSSCSHRRQMIGLVQYSEDNPIEIVTRHRNKEASHKLYELQRNNSPLNY